MERMDLQLTYTYVNTIDFQTHHKKYTFLLVFKAEPSATWMHLKTSDFFESQR